MTDEQVDLEVARYALRTFVDHSRTDWLRRTTGSLGSVVASGRHWEGGVCKAQCLIDDIDPSHKVLRVHELMLQNAQLWRMERNDIMDRLMQSAMFAHDVPDIDCRCGAYGALSLEDLVAQYAGHSCRIIAVMAAEGPTVIGPRGLRTAFARIVAFWSPHRGVRKAARQLFGDEPVFFNDLFHMLASYNLPVASEKHIGSWKFEPPPDRPDWWLPFMRLLSER
jgi:hypothetical protein